MSRKVSPEAAALFVQAMTFGRVIDDVSSKKINKKSWDETFIFIMKKTILDDWGRQVFPVDIARLSLGDPAKTRCNPPSALFVCEHLETSATYGG